MFLISEIILSAKYQNLKVEILKYVVNKFMIRFVFTKAWIYFKFLKKLSLNLIACYYNEIFPSISKENRFKESCIND